MAALILDGTDLARRRAPAIALRAAAVAERRGYAPAFIIVAFSDTQGRVPHVARKLRQCAEAGIDVTPLIMPPGTATGDALAHLNDVLTAHRFDGVFLQFPFPAGIDGDALTAAIPVELDIDIMTPARTARFMNGLDALPPVTVSAGMLLLDEYGVSISGRTGIVVSDENPFALMFRAALVLRGADMAGLVMPDTSELHERVHSAELVVVSAGIPGLVNSAALAPGAVAIDVGYFNPGGAGDIDLSGGVDHLTAISPVPGGIGPMTVSALMERVVQFAERD